MAFRRVDSVSSNQVNLAYVGLPSLPADSMVDIIDPNGSFGSERRRIMYGDISGRLVDINGDSTVNVAYPIVTDLFYDKDADRQLDASEVIAEAALPYRYRSERTYFGRAVYASSGAPRERTVASGLTGGCSDLLSFITLDEYPTFDWNGYYMKVTEATYQNLGGDNPPDIVGQMRKVTISDQFGLITSYESSFVPDKNVIGTITFDLIEILEDEPPLFSLVGTENIKLVHPDGTQYGGRHMILLQKADSSEETINNGDEAGYGCSYIHVFLDRDDVELYLKFTAGTISSDGDGGYMRIGDVDKEHSEKVNAHEMFRYASMDTVTDPANEGKDIVASVPLGEAHGIFVSDRAFVDQRIIDPLYWRIRADVKRSTQVKSDTGVDELKVGVIGEVPDSLNKFLHGDSTFLFRMSCRNPYPLGGNASSVSSAHWQIDISKANYDWSQYDLVICRQWNIQWSKLYAIAAAVANGGGVFLIDTSSQAVTIDSAATGADKEYNVPMNMKLGITTPANPVTTVTSRSVADWVATTPGGYTISAGDMASVFPSSGFTHIEYNTNPAGGAPAWPDRKVIASIVEGGTTKKVIVEMQKGIVMSTIGFTDVDNDPTKQFFCNFIWAYSAADPTRAMSASSVTRTFSTPWENSWVAGWDLDGNAVLTDEEMVRFGFVKKLDAASGLKEIRRTLSQKTAETILSEYLVSTDNIKYLNGADSVDYYMEVSGHDPNHVHWTNSISPVSKPEAWSSRSDSPAFTIDSGYQVQSYMEEPTPGKTPGGPAGITATARVVGTLIAVDEAIFSFSFSQGYSYDTRVTVTKGVPLTEDSGYVDFVTTWSDIHWTAPHVWKDHNPRSKQNLLDYGHGGITAAKWYPWDGQSFLAAHSNDHGNYVKYIQHALNALAAEGRGHSTGKLKVDGTYGAKTQAAVHSYQKNWKLTHDGDVDAGTAGHIMRNAGTITDWGDLDDRYKKYGRMMNIVDGKDNTYSGRRTWINTSVTRMVDEIHIVLKNGMNITGIEITPHMLGSGAEEKLHIFRIGGRRANNHKKHSWAFDEKESMKDAWKIKSGNTGSKKISLKNDLDIVTVGLYQDNPYHGAARQWGVKNVIAYAEVTETEVRTQWTGYDYNKKLDVASAVHVADVGSTITTKQSHGLVVGDKVYTAFATAGASGEWAVTQIINATAFVCDSKPASSTTETNVSGGVSRFLAIKLRTGERKTITLMPNVPAGATFKGWDAITYDMSGNPITTALETAIKNSMVPTVEADKLTVTVTTGAAGKLYVTFYSPLENKDNEQSIGRDLTLTMDHSDIYGIDKDEETVSCTGATSTTISNAKYWPVDSLKNGTIRFISGALMGQTKKILSNTNSQITVAAMSTVPTAGDTYILTKPFCDAGAIEMTAAAGSGTTTLNSVTRGLITGTGFGINTLVGYRVLITSGTNDRKSSKIIANTDTAMTLEENMSIAPNDTFLLLTGHWPVFDKLDEDIAYTILYRVDTFSNSPVMGVFTVVDDDGKLLDVFHRMTLADMKKYGLERIRISMTNLHVEGDPSIGGLDRFPVRYAMKPFCVIEKTHGSDLDVLGLSADQPNEIWGLRIESATVKRKVRIPQGLSEAADGLNNISSYASIIRDCATREIECVYNVGTRAYSSTYGEPFVDVFGEWLVTTEAIKAGASYIVTAKTRMAPIHVDDDGNPVVEAMLNGLTDVSIKSVDLDKGLVQVVVNDPDFSPENDLIKANYTFREQYVTYKGAGVTTVNGQPSLDSFDLCPYHGHSISTPDGLVPTHQMIGKPIYVYAMPTTVKVDQTVINSSRSLFHTTYAPMFDPTSPFYNPFAMLLSVATVKGLGAESEVTLIDTRRGGGGIVDASIIDSNQYTHRTGFNELEGFFDIGHLDGSGYLLGGSVVMTLPLEWKTAWTDLGLDANKMATDFCSAWMPAGKSWTVAWTWIEEGTGESMFEMIPMNGINGTV